jgi:transcription-repair coupling factor (superfamily II helicase)
VPGLTGVLEAVLASGEPLQHVVALARRGTSAEDSPSPTTPDALDVAAPPSARSILVGALATDDGGAGRTVLAVTATAREADALVVELADVLATDDVALYPAWETLPHERLSPRSDTVGQRLAVLRRLAHPQAEPGRGRPRVVVTPVRAVLQPQAAGLGDIEPVHLRPGSQVELEDLVRALVDAGYHRADLVERRGEFAVRGGLVDVFPPTASHPRRVELWGDEVAEIREFGVADQRSLGAVDDLFAPACRELLLTEEVRRRAGHLAEQHPELAELLTKVSHGTAVEGMESLAPALLDDMELLLDVLPGDALVLVCDPERVRARAHDLSATDAEFKQASWAAAADGADAPIDLSAASFRPLAEVRAHALARGQSWWSTSPFSTDDFGTPAGVPTDAAAAPVEATTPADAAAGDAGTIGAAPSGDDLVADEHAVPSTTLGWQPVASHRGDQKAALGQLRDWLGRGWATVLVAAGQGTLDRAAEVLGDEGIPVRRSARVTTDPVVHLCTGRLTSGFVDPDAGLAVLTERDLTGRDPAGSRRDGPLPSRRRHQVDPLTLQPGDIVVHDQHGVGKYVEMRQRTVGGAVREYLVLEYAPGKRGQPPDRLFVPTDQLEQVTRYVGGDTPALDRIGGADWSKRKGRARKAVRQIAGELIQLYAARQAAPGRSFGPDTPWQRELEDAFAYVETPDQASTIDEVKRDMERPVPMDRVICGDVGYGKTEIAVRAAFKAVQDGAQVAVLVPTTLLVQQHLQTFSERYAPFPVVVKALSRFQSDVEAEAVRAGVADGTVDVVIGTHRLLTGDVRFKNLGLVVVDEEQRFGVEHKERLKHLRANVDVLTMSATPIPRTLEMSITGIRDMSTITTPPEERHPVLTYVGAYDDRQVAAAVRRELLREGQVFLVHNRVATIEKAAARLRESVPEARVAVAHGQMNEHTLEQVIVDFWERRADVLVCTTIVETGLDIANANTLIVDRADLLGLSQLHQLRGRVGRGRERAYAYFLYPRDRSMTDTAHQRLATIAQHTELGAGMQVAMKDLEIRGAGNLLGAEQSGQIADVGFDLYVRMVGEAVAEYRGEADEEPVDMRVELPIDAHLPHDYVPSERLRLEAYRRLSEADDAAAIDAVADELRDRYGEMPEPVANLLAVARLRALARSRGLREVVLAGQQVRLAPLVLADSMKVRLGRLYPKAVVKAPIDTVLVPRPKEPGIGGRPLIGAPLLAWVEQVVRDLTPEPVQAA